MRLSRVRAAWRVLRGHVDTVPPPAPAAPSLGPGIEGDAMGEAVALVTEALRPGGGDLDVINSILIGAGPRRIPIVAAAAAVLASQLGQHWARHDPAGPAELLACIGLAAADRPGVD